VTHRLSFLWVVFGFQFLIIGTALGQKSVVLDPAVFDDLEMGMKPGRVGGAGLKEVMADEKKRALFEHFKEEYVEAGEKTLPVFEKYIGPLGAEALLDFLEDTYPLCHGQSHTLGEAIFGHHRSLGQALVDCNTRCTTGCMHGVMRSAFGEVSFEDLKKQIVGFCDRGEMSELHKPGNCAHGVGHALMMVSGRELGKALDTCNAFGEGGMAHFCATGVFMEYMITGKTAEEYEFRMSKGLHYPCDTFTQFPAACYRYKIKELMRVFDNRVGRALQECAKLPGKRRLGCFHGVGSVLTDDVANDPTILAKACQFGTPEDQIMCIEGVVEKLSDYDESMARAACETLEGRNREICNAAADGKMYRHNKPNLPLYYEQLRV